MNVRLKKDVQEKIDNCFSELKKLKLVTMNNTRPIVHIQTNEKYSVGSAYPEFVQTIYLELKLFFDKDCIEVVNDEVK